MADKSSASAAGRIAAQGQALSPTLPKDASSNTTGATWGNTPVLTPGMTFSEIGVSGLRQFSGWVREEFLLQLVGRQAAQKYREMRDNSPTVGGILHAIESTMRKVEWRVMPANDGPEAQEMAEFVEECMDDMSSTWEDTVSEILTMVPFGYAPLEIIYKRRNGGDPGADPDNPGEDLPASRYEDGKIGWRRLPLRGQDTVLKWFFNANGMVKGLTQQPYIGPLIDIPIEKMLLFRARPYKQNPEGISCLRNSYVPYYYIKRMQEQEAILAERLCGLPHIKVPMQLLEAASSGDANAARQLDEYKRIGRNVRIDEQMCVILPSNVYDGLNGPSSVPMYSFELITPEMTRSGVEFDKTITRYKVDMMTSLMADFLQLGHEARGTQSLAVSKVDMFFQAVEGWLNSAAAVFDRYGLPRLWRINGLDEELMPHMEPDLAQRVDLDVLSNFVLRLSQAGMPMFPNEELEQYILDAAGLPDVTDDRALQAAGVDDATLDIESKQKEEALAQQQVMTENLKNPPEPSGPPSNLKKMIAASAAKRQRYHSGPRFGVSTKKRHKHRKRTKAGS